MTQRFIALAVALMLVGGQADAAGTRLRTSAIVEAGVVTLGDVLEHAGVAAGAVVAPAPAPGKRGMIGVSRIYAVARANGLEWRPLRGASRVIIRRASQRISRPVIEERLREALAEEAPGKSLRVTLAHRTVEINLPIGAPPTLVVEDLGYDRRRGRFSATLVAARGTVHESRTMLTGRAFPVVEVPALRRRVRRDEIIGEGDIEWIELRADRMPPYVVTDPADLVGLAPRRALRPGVPIRANDVRAPIVVAKGAKVSMTYRTPIMVLTVAGRAIEGGAMGATIRVLNIKSKRIIDATVAGSGLVTVASRPAY